MQYTNRAFEVYIKFLNQTIIKSNVWIPEQEKTCFAEGERLEDFLKARGGRLFDFFGI